MSQPTIMTQNTLEQILSADMNRIGTLYGRGIMDRMLGLVGSSNATFTPPAVVERGLVASPGVGLQTLLSPGQLYQVSASPATDTSALKLGGIDSQYFGSQALAHTAADPTNPRIDLISASISTSAQTAQVRNILTLPSRAVTPTLVNKTLTYNLTLTVTAGTPNANPQLPAIPAGNVALWYVLIPANAVSITDNFYMDARIPAVSAVMSNGTQEHYREGGLHVALGLTSSANVMVTSGRGYSQGSLIEALTSVEYVATSILDSGGALAVNTTYNMYLVAPGPLTPVGKNIANHYVPCLSQQNPTSAGLPTATFNYNPLANVGGAPLLKIPNTTGLYVGTISTIGTAAVFEPGGQLSVGGRSGEGASSLIDPATGQTAPLMSAFFKTPHMRWIDNNTIGLSNVWMLINGYLATWFDTSTISFAGNIATGEVRTVSTWYYVYVRPFTSSVLSGVTGTGRRARKALTATLSKFAPNEQAYPSVGFTPDTGADAIQLQAFEYLCVGSVYNNSANQIEQFWRDGDKVLFTNPSGSVPNQALSLPTGILETTSALLLPTTSRLALVSAVLNAVAAAAGNASFLFSLFHQTGNANSFFTQTVEFPSHALNDAINLSAGQFQIACSTGATPQFQAEAQAFTNISGSPALSWIQQGYVEDPAKFSGNGSW